MNSVRKKNVDIYSELNTRCHYELIAIWYTTVLAQSEYYVKDSWTFANFIKDKQIPEDYVLLSLDTNVTSDLFENSIRNN